MPENVTVKISEIISGPAAIILLIAFFMPWVTISCSTTEITYTGYDLAAGTSSDEDVPSSAQDEAEDESDVILFGIPLAGLAALGIAIRRTVGKVSQAQARWTYLAAGIIGLILLGLKYAALQSDLSDAEEQVGEGVVTLTYEIGWWLTALCLFAIIAAAFLITQGQQPTFGPQGQMVVGDQPPPSSGEYPPPQPPVPPSSGG